MFKGRDHIRLIYYEWDEARPRFVALDEYPSFDMHLKEMREGKIPLDKLGMELNKVATQLFALAQEYSIAATVASEYGPKRIQEAIDKAKAICNAYNLDLDADYDDKYDYELVDIEIWTEARTTYGKLTSVDKFLLAELGLDQLLTDAMKVVVLAHKEFGEGD